MCCKAEITCSSLNKKATAFYGFHRREHQWVICLPIHNHQEMWYWYVGEFHKLFLGLWRMKHASMCCGRTLWWDIWHCTLNSRFLLTHMLPENKRYNDDDYYYNKRSERDLEIRKEWLNRNERDFKSRKKWLSRNVEVIIIHLKRGKHGQECQEKRKTIESDWECEGMVWVFSSSN